MVIPKPPSEDHPHRRDDDSRHKHIDEDTHLPDEADNHISSHLPGDSDYEDDDDE